MDWSWDVFFKVIGGAAVECILFPPDESPEKRQPPQ